jgi:hypothetical protein
MSSGIISYKPNGKLSEPRRILPIRCSALLDDVIS